MYLAARTRLTAFSNPPRENTFNTWEKMLHTFIEVESPVVELVLAEPNPAYQGAQPLTGSDTLRFGQESPREFGQQ